MRPHKISFYAYAEDDTEVKALEKALFDFVTDQYGAGALVTCNKIADALRTFGRNPLISRYFNG